MNLSWLAWVSVGALLIGLALVWKALSRPGVVKRLKRLVLGLAFAAAGVLGLGLTLALQACQAFVATTPVAEVRCAWTGPQRFNLTIALIEQGRRGLERTVALAGDQWSIGGGIIKWHPWLTALGVPNYHQLTRLGGGFLDAAQERAQPPTVVELAEGLSPVWWWLYRLDPYLPFIDAAYGSAAFMPVDPAFVHEVRVSTSGYLIRRTHR